MGWGYPENLEWAGDTWKRLELPGKKPRMGWRYLEKAGATFKRLELSTMG